MARVGKFEYKRRARNKVQLEKKGSDESDEDYSVSEDEEFDESDDEYCSSLAEDESEESLGECEEEEELEDEWVQKKVKKARTCRGQKVIRGSKKNRAVKHRKRKIADSDEEEEDDDADYDYDGSNERKRNKLLHNKDGYDDSKFRCSQENNYSNRKTRKNTWVSCAEMYRDVRTEKPRKKKKVTYREESEDDFNNFDDDNDEEFTPDEVDSLDDEEELHVKKKNKVSRPRMPETQISKGHMRKKNANNTLERTKMKRAVKQQDFGRRNRSNLAKDLRRDKSTLRKKKKSSDSGKGRRSRKSNRNSDSDFVSSASSDYEYTISEEEREQIREANEFCKRLTNNMRSSSSLYVIKEEKTVSPRRKHPGRKGKEKETDMKIEVGKQVCGICLSEEGKRTVRGILNCCSHYFCFACIMEWSKVESRCPLCKQRFATISRPPRADGGHDLRDAVISVPERDQVYQPSEEELRGYLDPYENVLCTECNLGGDDALMLLCDVSDSPAHTYCVGLGREVPDGHWYCDVCRPTAGASANSQAPNSIPDHGVSISTFVGSPPAAPTVRETFDLNEIYVPETPLSQVTAPTQSPRFSIGECQTPSPTSGTGASTVSERRRIQQHIRQVVLNRSRESMNWPSVSNINLFGSQITRDVAMAHQHALMPVRLPPQNICIQERLQDYRNPSLYSREFLSPRMNSLREVALHNQASTSTNLSFVGIPHQEVPGTNSSFSGGFVHQHLHPCNGRSQTGAEASTLPYQFREVSYSSLEKEQVQSMVRSHLKSLSRNCQLGYSTFKGIARTSTHTILAAFGHEHRRSQVHPVRVRPLICDHFEDAHQIGGQCSSCFERFVKNVVREIMYTCHQWPPRP